MLEQLPAASDVFTITVSNIPPSVIILVDLIYVGGLKKHDS